METVCFGSSLIYAPSHSSRPLSLRFRASAADVPDFLSADWLESRRKRPFGPRLSFSAEEAVTYQLDALMFNDQPRPDYGIEVMYRFAGFDPFERSTYFGPFFDLGQFERFRRIFHHSSYRVLLGHRERKILSSLNVNEVMSVLVATLLISSLDSLNNRHMLDRIAIRSEYGYEELGLRRKKYFNLRWYRGLVVLGMAIG